MTARKNAVTNPPMTPLSGKLGALGEIHLPVRDLALMRDFYAKRLGLGIAFEHSGRMVALRTGGAMLVLDSEKEKRGPSYLGFKAKESKALIERLGKAGVRIVLQPELKHWGELLSEFEDPEGNVLYLEESVSNGTRRRHHHRS